MTRIKSKLAVFAFGLGLILSLIALPPVAGAASNEAFMIQYPHHRYFSSEEAAQQTPNRAIANYAMVEFTDADYAMVEMTDLEQIAGRGNLDAETIKFLEDNIWLLNSPAGYAMAEPTELERIAGRRNLDLATIKFLEENLWIHEGRAVYQGPIDPDSRAKREFGYWKDIVEPYADVTGVDQEPSTSDGAVVIDEMNGY